MDPSELFPAELAEELTRLDSYVRSRRRQSLPDLLRAWHRYTGRLSTREAVDLDDYVAMLFARDAIQDVGQRASPTVGGVILALVGQDDSVFMLSTHSDEANVVVSVVHDPGTGWWWSRVPGRFTQAESSD